MNLETPCDVLCSTFHVSLAARKVDDKDCQFFDSFYGFLVMEPKKNHDERKLEVKKRVHFLEDKGPKKHRERG